MAKFWAKSFYNSVAWLQIRHAYIISVNGLCERCISPTPGYIVHHKIELNPTNINAPEITLNHENLEYVCIPCHNNIHFGSHEDITREDVTFDNEGNLIQRGENIGTL